MQHNRSPNHSCDAESTVTKIRQSMLLHARNLLFFNLLLPTACATHSHTIAQHKIEIAPTPGGYLNRLAQEKNLKIFAIIGAPMSGKSTLLRKLQTSGHIVVTESAREIIEEARLQGDDLPWQRLDFQDKVAKRYFEKLESVLSQAVYSPRSRPVFIDRGPLDTLAYFALQHRKVSAYTQKLLQLHPLRCAAIFVLDSIPEHQVCEFNESFHAVPIKNLKPDPARRENSRAEREKNIQAIRAVYKQHNAKLIPIVHTDLIQREKEVLQKVRKLLNTTC
ncbi:MAG: ATP-binding protein [Myxococcota bacterium]